MAPVLRRALFVLALAGLACFAVPAAAEAMTASLVRTGTQTLEWDIHASPDVFERTALYRLEITAAPGERNSTVDARDGEADRIVCQTTSTNGIIRFAVDPQDVVQRCKPKIRTSQRELRVSRTGTVALRLDCDYGGPPCSGVARLSLLGLPAPTLERRFAFRTGYGGKLVWRLSTTTRRALRARDGRTQALLVIAIDNASDPPKRRQLPVRLLRRHSTVTPPARPRSVA